MNSVGHLHHPTSALPQPRFVQRRAILAAVAAALVVAAIMGLKLGALPELPAKIVLGGSIAVFFGTALAAVRPPERAGPVARRAAPDPDYRGPVADNDDVRPPSEHERVRGLAGQAWRGLERFCFRSSSDGCCGGAKSLRGGEARVELCGDAQRRIRCWAHRLCVTVASRCAGAPRPPCPDALAQPGEPRRPLPRRGPLGPRAAARPASTRRCAAARCPGILILCAYPGLPLPLFHIGSTGAGADRVPYRSC